MLLGNQWFRRVKNRGREGTERREWQAYPGSCATSSQISMFFAQSISLSLSLVAAFTISAAIFSPRLLHPITRSLLSLPSKSRPVIIHRTGREEIPVSCNEAIPSVKIAPLSTKPQPARSHSALAEGGRRRRCNLELEDRIDGRGREAVARTNLDRPQVHPRRAASRFGLATAVARPWRRRHAHWISDLSRGRGICQNMSMYVAALQNIPCLGELVKKYRLIELVHQNRSRVNLRGLTGGTAKRRAYYALTAFTHAVSLNSSPGCLAACSRTRASACPCRRRRKTRRGTWRSRAPPSCTLPPTVHPL
jgi:hypothetical protein